MSAEDKRMTRITIVPDTGRIRIVTERQGYGVVGFESLDFPIETTWGVILDHIEDTIRKNRNL